MAIPTPELSHIYEAKDGLEETESIMAAMLNNHRMMKAAALRQRDMLIDKKAKLVADANAEHTIPYATQQARLHLIQLTSMSISWLEQHVVVLDNAIRLLTNPPSCPRPHRYDESPTDDEI